MTYDLVFDTSEVPTTSELTETLKETLNSGFIQTSRYQLDINSVSYESMSSNKDTTMAIFLCVMTQMLFAFLYLSILIERKGEVATFQRDIIDAYVMLLRNY